MPLTYIDGLDGAIRQGLYEVLRGRPPALSRWRSELDALHAVWAGVVGWHEPRPDRPRVQHATDGEPVPDPYVEAATREYLAIDPAAALWMALTFVELHPPVQERDAAGEPTTRTLACSARAYARSRTLPPASRLAPGATWAELVAERTGAPSADVVAHAVLDARREFRERLRGVDMHPLRPRWLLAGEPDAEPVEVPTLVCGGPQFDGGVRTVCTLTTVILAPAPRARCAYCGQVRT